MTGNNPDGSDGDGTNKPTADGQTIARAIDALREDYETAESQRKEHDRDILRWSRIAGIGVGIYTLLTVAIVGASIYSAQQAKVSAVAASDSVGITKDTETRQLRAYLYVRRYPIVADQKTAAAKIEVYHAGVTPAYKIKIDAQMAVGRYLEGELILPDIASGKVSPVDHFEESILYNTESIPRTISMTNADEAMRLVWSKDPLIGDNRIYLHGVVRYLDIFGIEGLQPERRYEFCFVYHPERDAMGSERGCEKYNKPG